MEWVFRTTWDKLLQCGSSVHESQLFRLCKSVCERRFGSYTIERTFTAGYGFSYLGKGAGIGDIITLVGFGRSGYGSYGYTSNATLTDRHFGSNVIDSSQLDDEGSGMFEIFSYDFDDSNTIGQPGGSLGNTIETIIGPGDSGGAALRQTTNGWELVGINTFTEEYGSRFGDFGGGVLIEPYLDWIYQTSGIPEPRSGAFLLLYSLYWMIRR